MKRSRRFDPNIRMQVSHALIVEPLCQRRRRCDFLVSRADACLQRYRTIQDFLGYPADIGMIGVFIGLCAGYGRNH